MIADPRIAIADALTAAAYQCDGKCGLPEQECFNSHPITWSGMVAGHTHIDGSPADIAEVALVAIQSQLDALDRVRALTADMRTWCSPHGIATEYADRIDEAIAGPTVENTTGQMVHACPPDGSGITPCCGKTPFELAADSQMTTASDRVNCTGNPRTA